MHVRTVIILINLVHALSRHTHILHLTREGENEKWKKKENKSGKIIIIMTFKKSKKDNMYSQTDGQTDR